MHEVLEGEIDAIARPMVIFYRTNELKILELTDINTSLPENLQDNVATPPIGTHASYPHSPLEDTSVASAKPPPCTHIDTGYAPLQVSAGDLPDVRLLGANNMLFGVDHNWVHQNPREH